MKRTYVVVLLSAIFILLFAGCTRSLTSIGEPGYKLEYQYTPVVISSAWLKTATPVAVPTATAQPTRAVAVVETQVATATKIAVPTKTAEPTATVQTAVVEESLCPLSDQGIQIDFAKIPDSEGFYNLSDSIEELAAYQGCNVLVEGRQVLVEEHHIWVFFDPAWTLKIREGSLWVYPQAWNMDDFSAEKAPIVTEFVVAKRHNQLQNGYDWPIFVHTFTGNSVMFPAGSTLPEVVLPDNAQFVAPMPIEIHGVWDGKGFVASIGGEKTTTVALLDGELVFWLNAKDNIPYESAQAWTMPSTWSQDQIEAWAKAQFPNKKLEPYQAP